MWVCVCVGGGDHGAIVPATWICGIKPSTLVTASGGAAQAHLVMDVGGAEVMAEGLLQLGQGNMEEFHSRRQEAAVAHRFRSGLLLPPRPQPALCMCSSTWARNPHVSPGATNTLTRTWTGRCRGSSWCTTRPLQLPLQETAKPLLQTCPPQTPAVAGR